MINRKEGGRMNKKVYFKNIIKISVLCIVLLIAVFLVLLIVKPGSRKTNGVKLLSFSTGEALQGYSVWDSQGRELDVSEISEKETLVVFAMKGCRDCIADYDSYRILFPLYDSENFSVAFVWDDEIPQEQLDKMNIPPEASYSAKGKYKFTDWVPSYYFVDRNDTIVAQTTEMSETAELLPQITVDADSMLRLSGGVPILLGVSGCGACKKAVETLEQDGTDYMYVLQEEKLDKASDDAIFVDEHKLISKAFQIEEYPTYIYVDSDENLIIDEK
jgi:glutaredoxin